MCVAADNGSWTRARLPFVVWDADLDWPPGEGNGSARNVHNGVISEIRISRRTDSGESVIVVTIDNPDRAHDVAAALPYSFTSLPDRQTTSVPPRNGDWQESAIVVHNEPRRAMVYRQGSFRIAVVTIDVSLVVACYRCDFPNIIPATLGTIADIV